MFDRVALLHRVHHKRDNLIQIVLNFTSFSPADISLLLCYLVRVHLPVGCAAWIHDIKECWYTYKCARLTEGDALKTVQSPESILDWSGVWGFWKSYYHLTLGFVTQVRSANGAMSVCERPPASCLCSQCFLIQISRLTRLTRLIPFLLTEDIRMVDSSGVGNAGVFSISPKTPAPWSTDQTTWNKDTLS